MRLFLFFVVVWMCFQTCIFAQATSDTSSVMISEPTDTSSVERTDTRPQQAIASASTGHQKTTLLQRFPPYRDSFTEKMVLRNQHASFGQKFLRGSGMVFGIQMTTFCLLLALPERFSNWDKQGLQQYRQNFRDAFTKPPVIDNDSWVINYVGHPYQGAYYYNSTRSQGAKVWQAALVCIGHSLFWEYTIEAGFERPSLQDMVITPAAGILLGELFHFASVRMSRNGFKWYEAAFVSIFNPMYAINNGFKFAKK